MSNVIKAYSVRYETNSKMTIDYSNKDIEILAKRESMASQTKDEQGFEVGLQAVVVDSIEGDKHLKEEASKIIENAKKEAAIILEKANEEARSIKEDSYKQSEKLGYEEGIKKASLEIQHIKEELAAEKARQIQEYKNMLSGIEGQLAEVIASLVTKLTGILVEDKKDIILYLLEQALFDCNRNETYIIRVGKGDYDLLLSKKSYLEEKTGCNLQISLDSQLEQKQCLIETESKVIDCSLDVQLDNLVKDIKMLSSLN